MPSGYSTKAQRTRMKNGIQTVNHQGEHFSWSGDIFDHRYYKPNKRLLSFIGQWPYQLQRERTIKFYFIIFLGCSGLGPQMRALLTARGKLDLIVASLTPLVTNVGCLGVLTNFQYNRQQIRNILDQTRQNWECMRGLPQMKFLQEHGETGRLFTLIYSILTYMAIAGWILIPLLPKFLDVVAPLNRSRQRLDIIPTDYMLDPDKFFWPIFFHLGIGMVVILSILVTIDSFYMSLAQHACGMFEILRHDIENILHEDLPLSKVMLNTVHHADLFFHNIVSCIKRHKSLIEYINAIRSTCEWTHLVTVCASTLFLSFTGYLVVAKSTPKEEALRMSLASLAQIYHLYCISLPGHWISSTTLLVSDAAYNCKWHMMSIRSRKLILLLIRASINPCVITAGKVYVMSMENFCTILKTSMSYLAVLTSIQSS